MSKYASSNTMVEISVFDLVIPQFTMAEFQFSIFEVN
jgi:hypothetical protein